MMKHKKSINIIMNWFSVRRIIFIFCWLLVVIPSYIWLVNHPECTTFELSNIVEMDGSTRYYINDSGFPEFVDPPCAYYVYNFIKKVQWPVRILAFGYIAFFVIYNRKMIKKMIDKLKDAEL